MNHMKFHCLKQNLHKKIQLTYKSYKFNTNPKNPRKFHTTNPINQPAAIPTPTPNKKNQTSPKKPSTITEPHSNPDPSRNENNKSAREECAKRKFASACHVCHNDGANSLVLRHWAWTHGASELSNNPAFFQRSTVNINSRAYADA